MRVANALLMSHILYRRRGGEFATFKRIVRLIFGVRIRHYVTPYVERFNECFFFKVFAFKLNFIMVF